MATRYYANDSWMDKMKNKVSCTELVQYQNGVFELDLHSISSIIKAELTHTRKNLAIFFLVVSLVMSYQMALLLTSVVLLHVLEE